jgi:transcriptional regulator with XRE-family HTH domain
MELSNEDQKLTPAVRLGRRVRRLREARGLSIRQLCEQSGIGPLSHSYLGRVELGQQLPSEDLVRSLDRFFGTDGVLFELWEMAAEETIPDYTRKAMKKEADAVRIRVFNSSMIPALLQTKDYMKDVFRRSLPDASEDKLNELVSFRMRRQRILEREEPPYYWAIMDESALRRPMGGTRKMAAQLQHLLQMAKRPYVTVQVIPFSAGPYPLLSAFLTLHMLENGGMIAGIEGYDTGESVESPKRLAEAIHRLDLVSSLALTDEQSIELIRECMKGYENDRDS